MSDLYELPSFFTEEYVQECFLRVFDHVNDKSLQSAFKHLHGEIENNTFLQNTVNYKRFCLFLASRYCNEIAKSIIDRAKLLFLDEVENGEYEFREFISYCDIIIKNSSSEDRKYFIKDLNDACRNPEKYHGLFAEFISAQKFIHNGFNIKKINPTEYSQKGESSPDMMAFKNEIKITIECKTIFSDTKSVNHKDSDKIKDILYKMLKYKAEREEIKFLDYSFIILELKEKIIFDDDFLKEVEISLLNLKYKKNIENKYFNINLMTEEDIGLNNIQQQSADTLNYFIREKFKSEVAYLYAPKERIPWFPGLIFLQTKDYKGPLLEGIGKIKESISKQLNDKENPFLSIYFPDITDGREKHIIKGSGRSGYSSTIESFVKELLSSQRGAKLAGIMFIGRKRYRKTSIISPVGSGNIIGGSENHIVYLNKNHNNFDNLKILFSL